MLAVLTGGNTYIVASPFVGGNKNKLVTPPFASHLVVVIDLVHLYSVSVDPKTLSTHSQLLLCLLEPRGYGRTPEHLDTVALARDTGNPTTLDFEPGSGQKDVLEVDEAVGLGLVLLELHVDDLEVLVDVVSLLRDGLLDCASEEVLVLILRRA